MNLVSELLKQTEKIDFLFPNSFDQLMNDEYYDYDKFEWFLYYLFKLDGVDVKKIGEKGKGDGGADLILSYPLKDGSVYRIGIQAKYWKNRVGTAPINQLASAQSRHNLTNLWIITTSDLTSDAKEIAESMKIKILRAEDVKGFIEKIKNKHQEQIEKTGSSSIEFLPITEKTKVEKPTRKTKEVSQANEKFEEDLRKLRLEIAKKHNLYPVYNVYNNAQMKNLIEAKPKTKEELLKVSGFGPVKVDRFGEELINYFNSFIVEEKDTTEDDLYNALIKERINIAKFNKMKQADVYKNQVAKNLAKMKPKTVDDLKRIFGFKEENIEVFGDYLIRFINRQLTE